MAYHYLDDRDYRLVINNLIDLGVESGADIVETLGRAGILPESVQHFIETPGPSLDFDSVRLISEAELEAGSPRWVDNFEDQFTPIHNQLYDLVEEFRVHEPIDRITVEISPGMQRLAERMTEAARKINERSEESGSKPDAGRPTIDLPR